jgi:hypothetical protein
MINRRKSLTRIIGIGLAVAMERKTFAIENRDIQEQQDMTTNPRLVSFVGGNIGTWQITQSSALIGDPLPDSEWLDLVAGDVSNSNRDWVLRGVTSNERYVTSTEKEKLIRAQEPLGRPDAKCAVLIPIRKNSKWWALTQDERRQIFEEQSHHNQIGMDYLPAIARKLHHCRDLSESEPFDFLTWFEFAEKHTKDFNRLLERLRSTAEWTFVEREVEIRLSRK